MPTFSATEQPECWFIFQGENVLLSKTNAKPQALSSHEIQRLAAPIIRQHFLGNYNATRCYCAEVKSLSNLPSNFELFPLREALQHVGPNWHVPLTKARTILNWDMNHQYCGRCGKETMATTSLFERVCPVCDLSVYPRISPSMIVRIQRGNEILLARSPHFKPGVYGLVAGFVEAGENIEDTIHREVKEEVGIQIKNLRYFGSQAWPFPDSLMIGFTAEHAAGDITIDNIEIEAADWFKVTNLPNLPAAGLSIARKLIDHFIEEQHQKLLASGDNRGAY